MTRLPDFDPAGPGEMGRAVSIDLIRMHRRGFQEG